MPCFANLHAPGAEVGKLTPRDTVFLAAACDLQAVVAEVREPAVLEHAVAHPFPPHRARHPHRRLAEAADLRFCVGCDARLVLSAVETIGETPFRVRKSQSVQQHTLDELPGLGPALEADHLHEHGRNGLDFGKLLTWARQVVERAGRVVEIPLTRLVQEFERPFRVIEVVRLQPEDGALAEADHALLLIHANDRQPRLDPLSHRDHFGVSDGVPRLQIARAEAEASLALGPLGRLIGEFGDREVAPVGMPGARSPLAIDPEFPEIPFALPDGRNLSGPQLLAFDGDFLPARDRSSTAQDGPRLRPGRKHQTGILRCQHHRRIEEVEAATDEHRWGLSSRAVVPLPQFPNRLERAGECRKGAVRPRPIRPGQTTEPLVIAICGDEEDTRARFGCGDRGDTLR